MATTATANPLDQLWCCMTCHTTFRFGTVRLSGNCDERHPDGLACGRCGDGQGLHPADGKALAIPEYHGEIGTRH